MILLPAERPVTDVRTIDPVAGPLESSRNAPQTWEHALRRETGHVRAATCVDGNVDRQPLLVDASSGHGGGAVAFRSMQKRKAGWLRDWYHLR